MNKRRIYTLHNGNEMHVLACSIQQAYFLANQDYWYDEMGVTGIIALRDSNRDDGMQWKVACIDIRQSYPPFTDGDVMSDKREQEFWDTIQKLKNLEFQNGYPMSDLDGLLTMRELRERVKMNKLNKMQQIKDRGLVKIGSKNQFVFDGWYEITERIDSPAKIGELLMHLRTKVWFTAQMQDDFLYLAEQQLK